MLPTILYIEVCRERGFTQPVKAYFAILPNDTTGNAPQAISHFEKLPDSDPENLIDVSPVTGEVINSGALDYETRRQVGFYI